MNTRLTKAYRSAALLYDRPLLAGLRDLALYLPNQLVKLLTLGNASLPHLQQDKAFYKILVLLTNSGFSPEVGDISAVLRDLAQHNNDETGMPVLLDHLYVLFEAIDADNAFKKKLAKLIHAFARQHGLPCKIMNIEKMAYQQLACLASREEQNQVLDLLGNEQLDRKVLNTHIKSYHQRIDQALLSLAAGESRDRLTEAKEKTQVILRALKKVGNDIQAQRLLAELLATTLHELAFIFMARSCQLANPEVAAWLSFLQRLKTYLSDFNFPTAAQAVPEKLCQALQKRYPGIAASDYSPPFSLDEDENPNEHSDPTTVLQTCRTQLKEITREYSQQTLYQEHLQKLHQGCHKVATEYFGQPITDPQKTNTSRYRVVFQLPDALKKSLERQRRIDDRDINYQMAPQGFDVSCFSPKQKAYRKRWNHILSVLGFGLVILVCTGEALVPLALSGMVLVGVCAFAVNYPLFKLAMNETLPELFFGKLNRDEWGNPLQPIRLGNTLFSREKVMSATVGLCIAAATGYFCLSLTASIAQSAALLPFLTVFGGQYIIGAVIGVAALTSLAALFYVNFGQAIKAGLGQKLRHYFVSRFVQEPSWGRRLKNAVALTLTVLLTATSTLIVSLYFVGMVMTIFMQPFKGVVGMSATTAFWSSLATNIAATVPNLFFIGNKLSGFADNLMDAIVAAGRSLYALLTTHPKEAYYSIQDAYRQICDDQYRAGAKALSWIQKVGIGLYCVFMNSYGQSLGPIQEPKITEHNFVLQTLVHPATRLGISHEVAKRAVQGNFFMYSAEPLRQDVFTIVEGPHAAGNNTHYQVNQIHRENWQVALSELSSTQGQGYAPQILYCDASSESEQARHLAFTSKRGELITLTVYEGCPIPTHQGFHYDAVKRPNHLRRELTRLLQAEQVDWQALVSCIHAHQRYRARPSFFRMPDTASNAPESAPAKPGDASPIMAEENQQHKPEEQQSLASSASGDSWDSLSQSSSQGDPQSSCFWQRNQAVVSGTATTTIVPQP